MRPSLLPIDEQSQGRALVDLGAPRRSRFFNAMLGAIRGVVRLDAQQCSTIFRGTLDARPLPPFRRFASCARRHHEVFPTSVSVDSFECAASLNTVLCVAGSLCVCSLLACVLCFGSVCSLFAGPGCQGLTGFKSKM